MSALELGESDGTIVNGDLGGDMEGGMHHACSELQQAEEQSWSGVRRGGRRLQAACAELYTGGSGRGEAGGKGKEKAKRKGKRKRNCGGRVWTAATRRVDMKVEDEGQEEAASGSFLCRNVSVTPYSTEMDMYCVRVHV